MEVILREDVENVGAAGQVVKVKNGFGRNFLLPKGLAFPATPGNKKRVEAEASKRIEKMVAQKGAAIKLAAKLEEVSLTFTAKVGENDRLFGSITSSDIGAELEKTGYVVDKRLIELDEPLKSVGSFKVPIKLHPEVRPEIRVWVVKE